MNVDRRTFIASTAATMLTGTTVTTWAQDRIVKIGMPMDFTRVYTFVTAEYAQGHRDYLTLINDRGGAGGYKILADITDHGNDIPRAIEAYERMKREGAVLIDPLSTPVARALVPRALEDKINMVTTLSGRSDAADGEAFPYVMPLSPNYWTQAGLLIDYFRQQDKDLRGKKIVLVHIDTPFGKEPIPIFQALAGKLGYSLQTFPYAPPGNDQAAIWPQVRRAQPDWIIFWGAGVGQTVALSEAVRNGLKMDRISSSVWLSESDMDVVGKDACKGVIKFEAAAGGRDPKVIQQILSEVVGKGKGAGQEAKVGTSYYNIGVMMAAIAAEGVRKAAEKAPNGPVTGPWLNAGIRSISDFTAEGMLPGITVTSQDHQGGGKGRIARWDGAKFAPQTDWFTANQDLVWSEIKKYSEEFKKSGK
ncbi:ABC transporter substrate-binding protein [Bradyrhizobium sp. LHD-71]|uniref:ABC transporter substrate-binding protein n=1 Tax=Bradyrhizobium sp. LHD-71 TaxID=3072141 RepID=UPI00280E077C|nr:ABC transporter substrate-binding protein [Bradyrhizobium sp. LHD-71]MDQ8727473.1 ABC transporter substrate-binding protein [Bradyrhizobium sp. LHD-71]